MFEEMMAMVEALVAVEDVYFDFYGGQYHLTVNDFEGFDQDWDEVMREFVDEAGVNALLTWMEEHASSIEGDFYRQFHFDGFDVEVGFTSYDI